MDSLVVVCDSSKIQCSGLRDQALLTPMTTSSLNASNISGQR